MANTTGLVEAVLETFSNLRPSVLHPGYYSQEEESRLRDKEKQQNEKDCDLWEGSLARREVETLDPT